MSSSPYRTAAIISVENKLPKARFRVIKYRGGHFVQKRFWLFWFKLGSGIAYSNQNRAIEVAKEFYDNWLKDQISKKEKPVVIWTEHQYSELDRELESKKQLESQNEEDEDDEDEDEDDFWDEEDEDWEEETGT